MIQLEESTKEVRKIITICGSYKFTDEMIMWYRKLTDMGYIVIPPAIGCDGRDKEYYTKLHFDKIEMSDAIFVVNVGGYVGESTTQEIEHAKLYNKEIYYLW